MIKDPKITSPLGFSATGIASGIKPEQALDLGLITCDVPAVAAAVYTTNAFQAAPLFVTQKSLAADGRLQAVIVNSGNANACTGKRGISDAFQMRTKVAEHLGIHDTLVAVASTGVIGEYLPMDRVKRSITSLTPARTEQSATDFVHAIMTTDTCTKTVEVEVVIGQKKVKIAGCAKGSGMIHPNMATMLGFITTDAQISFPALQQLLKQVTNQTFNMITVDGDCSTNDMVLVMASGLAGNALLHPDSPDWSIFASAFHYVCEQLAKQIARDGEGATRLVEVNVQGAIDEKQARQIAKAIVGSNLVKTAVFGSDVNWGRVICAAGYGDPNLNPDQIDVWIGQVQLVQHGQPIPYDTSEAKAALDSEKVSICLHLHQGDATATAWGCDLTYDYVKINASYRT